MNTEQRSDQDNRERALRLGLHGLLANWDDVKAAPWLLPVLAYEEAERTRRSLERRIKDARLGRFKPLADYDWKWPKKIDRAAVDDLFKLSFFEDGANSVLLGPNGVGKTMLLKNLAHHCVMRGYTVRFTTASAMLNELASQDGTAGLHRRLRHFVHPQLLCIDEVGYLSYDSRYADLLFEVITRRYEALKPVVLTTNKPFSEWPDVFPHAACVVTLVDRLIHRCEVLHIEGHSYRAKEAKERAAAKRAVRPNETHPDSRSSE
ncbi:MAG: ATP-binding protein [Polyangiaceae bacterium]